MQAFLGLDLQPCPPPGVRPGHKSQSFRLWDRPSLQVVAPEPSLGAKPPGVKATPGKSAWFRTTPRALARGLQGKDQPFVLPLVGVTVSVFTHSFP